MDNLNMAIETVYKKRERLILIGLTGRTGSGCTTVAKLLRKENIKDLDLNDEKTREFNNSDERKYGVIRKFMSEGDKWKPFVSIEVSSIILSFVFEREVEKLQKYLEQLLEEKDEKVINITDFEKVKQNIYELDYMFKEMESYSLANITEVLRLDKDKINDYFVFYTQTIVEYKNRIKDMLSSFSCYEMTKSRLEEKKMIKYHLYTYLMQKFGNNVRSSGNPYSDVFETENYYTLIGRVNDIIKIINRHMENKEIESVRICIDAIRNPFEAHFLRDRYRAFYLIAVSTEDEHRLNRLKMSTEELNNLDKIEYPSKTDKPQDLFYHQNIQQCLEISDIHIFNPNIENAKYYELTKQVLKYIALMLHPGLITPTHIERCMQLAYNAKYNSGCLSRQVGAVVTGDDFSIKSVGWNDAPKGQVPCNLRDIKSYCSNKDEETFSKYELCDDKFTRVMKILNDKIPYEKLKGRNFSYCFKDVYNGIMKSNNQVYTRSLHAEENAFLQISKYGGQGVENGKLFTTASPCELCAKKAYQLGIREIYYIDPYPGISLSHILTFGEKNKNNPKMFLFSGAIGNAYISLYAPRMALKDELEMSSGISCKDEAYNYGSHKKTDFDIKNIKHNEVNLIFKFESRSKIVCIREVEMEILNGEIEKIDKMMIWTGSSYDGTKLISSEKECHLIDEKYQEACYQYSIKFDNKINKGEHVKYKIQTDVKDEKKIMEPYFSHRIKNKTDNLSIILSVPKNIVKNVRGIEYADCLMETIFDKIELKETIGENYDEYELVRKKPNLFYSYSIEWDFIK